MCNFTHSVSQNSSFLCITLLNVTQGLEHISKSRECEKEERYGDERKSRRYQEIFYLGRFCLKIFYPGKYYQGRCYKEEECSCYDHKGGDDEKGEGGM